MNGFSKEPSQKLSHLAHIEGFQLVEEKTHDEYVKCVQEVANLRTLCARLQSLDVVKVKADLDKALACGDAAEARYQSEKECVQQLLRHKELMTERNRKLEDEVARLIKSERASIRRAMRLAVKAFGEP